MAVTRSERREQRRNDVSQALGATDTDAALDLLELLELAWHDCYGDITPPEMVIADVLVLSDGRLDGLIRAARLAVTDWRDARVAADALRSDN